MKAKIIGAMAAVLLAGWTAGTAWADFELYGVEQMTVDTSHGLGWLYGQSKAWVVSDGWVGWLGAYDSSSVDISDGSVTYLYAYEGSSVAISGGSGAYLYAYDTSTVNVSGGSVLAVQASQKSRATMSGGSVDYLYVSETGSVAISGGSVGSFDAYDSSTVTFHGYDLQAMGELSLVGDDVLGTGVLTGKWLDGTAWSIDISGHSSTAAIRAMSGPSTYGDANEDGVVDAADFIAMKHKFGMTGGATWLAGNFTVYTVGDDAVDWTDLQILTSNFGTTASGAAPAPEPATLSLLALGGLAILRRRRK